MLLFNSFIFNWRLITILGWFLPYINMYIHICPPFEPPSQLPPHPTPRGYHRAPMWVPWVMQQSPPTILHTVMCMSPCYSRHSAHCLLLTSPPSVHTSVLYVCASTTAVKIYSLVERLSRVHIYVLIPNICFSHIWLCQSQIFKTSILMFFSKTNGQHFLLIRFFSFIKKLIIFSHA